MPEESPIREQTIYYARENERGVLPVDPVLRRFSDNVTSFAWSPDVGIEPRRGLGSPDIAEFHKGPEEHEVTVEYDLQRFVVASGSETNFNQGDAFDASGDGVLRDNNNELPSTHTIVKREDIFGIDAEDTIDAREGGSGSERDTRLFVVVAGGRVDTAEFTGDPGSEQPVTVELTYTAEKGREYQVDQPDSATLDLVSTDASDTFDVTVEDDTGTAETVTLNGTTVVSTPSSFDSIRAIKVAQGENPTGDITVSEQSSGETLAIIRGSSSYDHDEGDEGIPTTGSGSRETSEIGTSYETIVGDAVERPSGTSLAAEINSVTFSVENNVSTREQITTPRMGINAGDRDVGVDTTIVGATESVQKAAEAFENTGNNVVWILDGGELRATNARLTEFAGVDESQGDAVMSNDNTFTGQSVEAVAT